MAEPRGRTCGMCLQFSAVPCCDSLSGSKSGTLRHAVVRAICHQVIQFVSIAFGASQQRRTESRQCALAALGIGEKTLSLVPRRELGAGPARSTSDLFSVAVTTSWAVRFCILVGTSGSVFSNSTAVWLARQTLPCGEISPVSALGCSGPWGRNSVPQIVGSCLQVNP